MTLSEQPEVRVIASTLAPSSITKAMIGKEYKVKFINYDDKTICADDRYFNFSDVQWLTPLSFNGRRVAVGDEVKISGDWRTVVAPLTLGENNHYIIVRGLFGPICINETDISAHRTPQDTAITELTLDDVAKKFGIDVKNLRIKE